MSLPSVFLICLICFKVREVDNILMLTLYDMLVVSIFPLLLSSLHSDN